MADTILEKMLKRIFNKNTTLLISSLTYHSIIALIPTMLLTMLILNYLNLNITLNIEEIFTYIGRDLISNLIIASFTIYLISRAFFILFKERFTLLKSLLFSISGSIFIIVFSTSFLMTYLIQNSYLEPLVKLVVIFIFFLTINTVMSEANFKFSLLFSLSFSSISFLMFYFFFNVGKSLLNYENYYGILAPIFLIILAINLFIYIVYFSYIGAEEFTINSNIKHQNKSKIIKARLQKGQ